jgi:hypothetical protein
VPRFLALTSHGSLSRATALHSHATIPHLILRGTGARSVCALRISAGFGSPQAYPGTAKVPFDLTTTETLPEVRCRALRSKMVLERGLVSASLPPSIVTSPTVCDMGMRLDKHKLVKYYPPTLPTGPEFAQPLSLGCSYVFLTIHQLEGHRKQVQRKQSFIPWVLHLQSKPDKVHGVGTREYILLGHLPSDPWSGHHWPQAVTIACGVVEGANA